MKNWGGGGWNCWVDVAAGALEFDNYSELIFNTTRYGYDILDHLRVVTDSLGNTTIITYNVLGQKIGMRDPDMGVWSYGYDAVGNLIPQTDALNQVLWFKYDVLNRVTEKRQTGSGGPLLARYWYDEAGHGAGVGQRTTMTDATGSTSWAYDAHGRVTSESKTINGAGTFTTSYAYDAMDRVVTMTYPSGEVVTQTYNNAAQLTQVRSATHNLAYASGMMYNPMGQLTQMSHGNNLTTTYTYAPLNSRLARIKVGSWLDLSYGYDWVGNVKAITDTTNSGQVQSFNYDALDRLITATTTSVGNGQYSESYQYNAIGNITYTSRLGNYSYPASGPTSVRPHAAAAAGSNQYTDDNNGNMLTRVEVSGTLRITYTQAWDVENRLVAVTNTVTLTVTRFYYDGDGQRVKKVESKNTTSTTTAYLGALYEKNVTTGITTCYYYAGSTRGMACRQSRSAALGRNGHTCICAKAGVVMATALPLLGVQYPSAIQSAGAPVPPPDADSMAGLDDVDRAAAQRPPEREPFHNKTGRGRR